MHRVHSPVAPQPCRRRTSHGAPSYGVTRTCAVAARVGASRVAIDRVAVSAFVIPTDAPESDGTFEWDRTTLILVEIQGGGERGLGYTYADPSAARLAAETLAPLVIERDPMDVAGCWRAMTHAVRNLGRPGVAAMGISAIDVALWDLKARLLDVSLVALLGATRESVPAYGSGGFTSYGEERLRRQLSEWVAGGISRVKMKVGRDAKTDMARVRTAREAIGSEAELFVDANGAYTRKQALAQAARFAAHGVTWFEEPVSSDDLEGLRLLRDRGPAGMDIAAGEYGYDLMYFRRMLSAGAVDVLQADATRCAGVTGFLKGAALSEAHGVPLSAHTAPSLHAALCCAAEAAVHVEYFHDHARIERMVFDGAAVPIRGTLRPDRSRPGFGLELRRRDAEPYLVWSTES
jgi:L-alanine-DL-glutamate epimerase-like enolase superfamily enzyme